MYFDFEQFPKNSKKNEIVALLNQRKYMFYSKVLKIITSSIRANFNRFGRNQLSSLKIKYLIRVLKIFIKLIKKKIKSIKMKENEYISIKSKKKITIFNFILISINSIKMNQNDSKIVIYLNFKRFSKNKQKANKLWENKPN
jgi:hypothetical protein